MARTMASMTATTPAAARPEPPRGRTTYRSVFAAGEFRVLFAGMTMYVLGFQFELLGLSVLIFAQTGSAFLTALAFSMGFAPQAVGGALFTALADRLPARVVIGTGLLTRAAPGLVIGLWPALPVPVMLALVAAAATIAPVFTAAISGLLPDVLDGDRYVLGRSVFNLTGAGTQIAGLGVGGVVLAAVPVRWLLLAAGGALVIAAVITRLGVRRRAARVPQVRARGIVRATVAGNVALLRDRTVRGLLLAQWLPAWLVAGAESLIVPYNGSLGRPASAAAPLLAAMPAGTARRARARGWHSRWPRRWACRCSRWCSALRCRWPAWPCWPAAPASPTRSASSRPSSTACRKGAGDRGSASLPPERWVARA